MKQLWKVTCEMTCTEHDGVVKLTTVTKADDAAEENLLARTLAATVTASPRLYDHLSTCMRLWRAKNIAGVEDQLGTLEAILHAIDEAAAGQPAASA